jgi:hypothetical protein
MDAEVDVLQYGAIGTPEKFFLKWKEAEADNSRGAAAYTLRTGAG